MKSLVQEHSASGAVTFLGRCPMLKNLNPEQADIYVSLNQLGNLEQRQSGSHAHRRLHDPAGVSSEVGAEDPTSRLLRMMPMSAFGSDAVEGVERTSVGVASRPVGGENYPSK